MPAVPASTPSATPARRRAAGRQRRALCPRHHRGGALCVAARRAGRGAHRLPRSRRWPRSRSAPFSWRPRARPSSHTMTPLLAVAEILAALVAGRGGADALAALERTEAQLAPSASICGPGAGTLSPSKRAIAMTHHPASPDRRHPSRGRHRRRGIEIVDSTGKRYIDASGGAAVSCLGHGHPARDGRAARAARQAGLRPYRLLHHRGRRRARRPA